MDNVLFNISHGMYVLTTNNGGCIVDAVCQVSGGDKPLISIAVMKSNNTNELLKNNNKACISIIGEKTNGMVIKEFGFNSMKNYDKFKYENLIDIDGFKVVKDSVGYIILEKVDSIENETHTLFIYRVIKSEKLNDDIEITYRYYREHKDELIKMKTAKGKTAWVCTICNYIYYGDELPEEYKCPICGVDKEMFVRKDN